jgi:hypothetical protein
VIWAISRLPSNAPFFNNWDSPDDQLENSSAQDYFLYSSPKKDKRFWLHKCSRTAVFLPNNEATHPNVTY